MHSELKSNSWHEISAQWPIEDNISTESRYDMFIGRFKDDKYHLMGYRPKEIAYLFSADSESRSDLGIVRLPNNKENISELVERDLFEIIWHGSKGSSKAKFIKSN